MGIYLHIPFCRQKCIYCDFPAYQGLQDYYDRYVEALCKEIDLWCGANPKSMHYLVDTVYFGGGTPTELTNAQLERILNHLKHYFTFKEIVKISIEANPGEITMDQLVGAKAMGVNRISFGVQTFNDDALQLLNRSHTGSEAIRSIEYAYEAGFTDINIDLIYALPNQSIDELQENLYIISKLPINHVSTYGLQVEDVTYLGYLVRYNKLTLPSEALEDSMYDMVMSELERIGFERYEISNFAKAGAYSRHNLRYWMYKDYLGFGAGAHSFYDGVRRGNNRNVVPYMQMINQAALPVVERTIIDKSRAEEDYCFLGLRTKWGIHEQHFNDYFHESLTDVFGDVLYRLINQGLLYKANSAYILTPEGAKHGNYVFEQFLR